MTIPKLLVGCCLLLIACQPLQAQKKDQATGKLTDSTGNNPIYSATVTLFNQSDTSILNYSLSDKDGVFRFTRIPQDKPLLLVVS